MQTVIAQYFKKMDNFDLRKYLTENRLLKEAYNISAEVEVGDIFYNDTEDQYEVVSVSDSHVELKPKTFRGENETFPKDFGDDVSIEDFWQHFEKVEDETRGPFGEPGDSNYFGNHIRETSDKKYLAENKLIKETKEEDYYNLLMDLKDTELDWITKRTFETLMMKRGMYDSFEDFLDDEIDFFQEEGNVEIIDKIKSTFLNENNLLKEYLDLEIDEDQVTINSYSGEYSGFIKDDNTVDFSVTGYEEEREDGEIDFDEDNWKDILGPKHAFVKITNQIPTTKVEAAGDYVMITVDLEDLEAIAD